MSNLHAAGLGRHSTWGMDSDRAADWRERGACRDEDPELFFADHVQSAENIAAAKAICNTCSVIGKCAAWVTANPQLFGVWAGTSPSERRAQREAATRAVVTP